MILFLTSSPDGDLDSDNKGSPFGFDNRNGFADRLRETLPEPVFFTMFASDPESYDRLDEAAEYFAGVFERTGIRLTGYATCDGRNAWEAGELLARSGVIMLSGGHVPTQNAFFASIGLREKLQHYDGVVIGVSAGTMNCAETVYAQPEEPGEAVREDYVRFLPGLGLTKLQILPHYQLVKDNILDGMRLFEDISASDSYGRCFLVLRDGSYVRVREDETRLFGEAWTLSDGAFLPLCRYGESMSL